MAALELAIDGDLPTKQDMEPLEAIMAVINAMQPDWLVPGTIGLKLTTDEEIQELNARYASNDYPTDVLSFSYLEAGNVIEGDLGDIIISTETAARQAKQADTTLADELGTLLAHGILHVFGFDHAEAEEREQMDALQGKIVTAANLTYRDFKWTH